MRMTSVRVCILAAAAIALAAAAAAQEGYPLAGTWYGDFAAGNQKNDLTVIMKWDKGNVTGLINPGPDSRPITSVVMTITPGKAAAEGQRSTEGISPKFHVRFEVDGRVFEGMLQNPVAGNRRLTGTWTRGSEKGTFQIRRL